MIRYFLSPIILLLSFTTCSALAASVTWNRVNENETVIRGSRQIFPDKYNVFAVNRSELSAFLAALPETPQSAVTFTLPAPDGSSKTFRVWQTPVIATGAAGYARTFTAVAVDDNRVTAKLDHTLWGFHAMIFDGSNTYFIDPYSNEDNGYYTCYYKRDYRNKKVIQPCTVGDQHEDELGGQRINLTGTGLPAQQLKVNGAQKHTYRLALACTGEYAVAVCGSTTPTKPLVLSAMITSMNRVNGVYERELGITMELVPNDTLVICLNGNNDPYSNSNGFSMKSQNQHTIDSAIGTLNYDIGHVFSTAGGGIAELKCVCDISSKAEGVTGQNTPVGDAFDIDYVAHEMGHQFGATHTFNSNTCGTANVATISSFEPGSGSTIMAYAGICDMADNIQAHSDDYFHAMSLDQVSTFISSPITGGSCGVTTTSGNTPAVVPSFAQTYSIPYLTPFEITAPQAADADHDRLTYCWEQWDLGDFGKTFNATGANGPIFRSFKDNESQTRIFPVLDSIINNVNKYLGEKLPDDTRTLNFTLTVRDIYNGWGCFNTPSDKITLNVINTGAPFTVSEPNTAAAYWQSGTNVQVKWNVANTNMAPINAANVDIFLSMDNGQTYPIVLATNTPNDGNEIVTVPAGIHTASARVKVKGAGNVFFDISNEGFIINQWPACIWNVDDPQGISIYPVPAKDRLFVKTCYPGDKKIMIYNSVGQQLMSGVVANLTSIDLQGWAAGVYYINVVDAGGAHQVRKFTIE